MKNEEILTKLKDAGAPLEKIRLNAIITSSATSGVASIIIHHGKGGCSSSLGGTSKEITWADLQKAPFNVCKVCGWQINMLGGWTNLIKSLETLKAIEETSQAAERLLAKDGATKKSVTALMAQINKEWAIHYIPKVLRPYVKTKVRPLATLYKKGLPQEIIDLFQTGKNVVVRTGKVEPDKQTLKSISGEATYFQGRRIFGGDLLKEALYRSGQKGAMQTISFIPLELSELIARDSFLRWPTKAKMNLQELEVLDVLIKDKPGKIRNEEFDSLVSIAQAL